jgi:hypothetical protein
MAEPEVPDPAAAAPSSDPVSEAPQPGQQGSMLLVPNLMLPDPIPLTEVHMLLSPSAIGSWIPQQEGTSGTVMCIIGAWNAACGAPQGQNPALSAEQGIEALQESLYKLNGTEEKEDLKDAIASLKDPKDYSLKYVGAWGVIAAIEKLRESQGTRVRASRLLGARQVGGRILGHQTFMTLKETDDEKKMDKQWALLKEKIMQPNTVLVFSQVQITGVLGWC